MNLNRMQAVLHLAQKAFWAAFLVSLPFTSFPYLPAEFGGRTQVRPLAIYPLLVLLLLVTLPRLFKKKLPATFLPLLAFVAAAILSSILALGMDLEAVKGVTMISRLLRNLLTLFLGVAIYFTAVLYQQDEEDLNFSLRWLYLGFSLALAWGSLQAIYILHFDETYFALLNRLQGLISTQELYPTRISGFTYEPKWFAEQITFLLMPWLLSAVILRRSVYRWRYRWLTVETLLLAWSSLVLMFTFSRTGLFVLVIITFISVLIGRRFAPPGRLPRPAAAQTGLQRAWQRLNDYSRQHPGLRWAEAALATLALAGILFFVGSRNPYFSRLWRYWSDERAVGKSYLEYIAFGQRIAYTETAFRIYEDYPFFGVGPGNYAFFFNTRLPNRPYQNLPEIIRQITPTERGNQLVTPKNLYARLLAETGLVGTVLFTSFAIAVLGCSLALLFRPGASSRYWGLAGLLGLIVFAAVVFSTDSFAVPNTWVVFGLTTAAVHVTRPEE
jgi:hypothetical protein